MNNEAKAILNEMREHGRARWAGTMQALLDDNKDLFECLLLLVQDVQDYEAWQRPCRALDIAKETLERLMPSITK
jgi:hypothetical protein